MSDTTLARSVLENDHQRLQSELQRLIQQRQQLDTAILAQRGAIAYVEMVLGRAQEAEAGAEANAPQETAA